MGKCKDCLHQELCKMYYFMLAEYKGINIEVAKIRNEFAEMNEGNCEYFYDNSKIRVELPCKVGDKIFFEVFGEIHSEIISEFVVTKTGVSFRIKNGFEFPTSRIGKGGYLTYEEAEQALHNKIADVGKKKGES